MVYWASGSRKISFSRRMGERSRRAHLLLVDPRDTDHQVRRETQRERFIRRCHLLAVVEDEEEM